VRTIFYPNPVVLGVEISPLRRQRDGFGELMLAEVAGRAR